MYYEVDGDSKHSLQSSTYGRSAGRDQEWVGAPPAPARTVTQAYVGFLGSRGRHAAVFLVFLILGFVSLKNSLTSNKTQVVYFDTNQRYLWGQAHTT